MFFDWLIDTEKKALREENAELRKELTEIKQRELLKELLTPSLPLGYLGSDFSIGKAIG